MMPNRIKYHFVSQNAFFGDLVLGKQSFGADCSGWVQSEAKGVDSRKFEKINLLFYGIIDTFATKARNKFL